LKSDHQPTPEFHEASEARGVFFDPWIAASALQKSVRRSEAGPAEQAASALFSYRRSATWKRFLVVAVEDVGIASTEALIEVVRICSDRERRRQLGSDEDAACYLARRLATAPKDRSADLLASAVCYHPWLETIRTRVKRLTTYERLDWVADSSRSFCERAVAAWFACGIGADHKRYKGDELRLLLLIFRDLDVPKDLIEAVSQAASRTREAFCALVPHLWLAARAEPKHETVRRPLPPTKTVVGLPLWAMDFHTRLGRAAIQRFTRENEAVRQVLQESVSHSRHIEAAYLAAFYTDAAPCALSLDWPLRAEIERLGIEADFARAGVPADRVEPVLAVFKSQVRHLNDLREAVLTQYLESVR
jgi:hypothetical protein